MDWSSSWLGTTRWGSTTQPVVPDRGLVVVQAHILDQLYHFVEGSSMVRLVVPPRDSYRNVPRDGALYEVCGVFGGSAVRGREINWRRNRFDNEGGKNWNG